MTEIDQIHRNPLTTLGPPAWHGEIVVYLFLGGIAAGVMILGALLARRIPEQEQSHWIRWIPFAAPVALSIGMLALFLDLEYRAHVYRFYLAFQPASPMSWGSWILIAIYPATMLLGLAQLKDDEAAKLASWGPLRLLRLGGLVSWAARWGAARLGGLRWANLLLGIGLGGYTGILLSSLGAARGAWNASILGPLFLVSGISTGAALMMLFPLADRERHALRDWDLAAIAVELALLLIFVAGLASGGRDMREAAALLLGGRLTAIFWALVVVTGLVVPFIIEAVEARKHLRPTILAPLLLLVGGLSLRWVVVTAGQIV